ncbi:two-component sensor histidine kinase [Flavobacterium sp. P4023]|uniref:histidine kinase n=1 Tax=Flavobacterium flabelliforme TaxID=2816119 RepID=A0ABS5CNM3_9FLAO|nr:ATP-binding protein [Flavobacterium flabelliforme]MBP4140225.1 two-component sensor histidine kinase [Flavobacterium flabelliforme]
MPLKHLFIALFLGFNFFSFTILAAKDKKVENDAEAIIKEAIDLMRNGSYEKSLIRSRLGLKLAICSKDNNLIASAYNTIAANFDQLSEYDKAFYYYHKGLTYANKTNNDILKNWINNNLGNIYCFDKKQYEKGIYYYKKSLEYSIKSKDSSRIVFTKVNLTWAYFDIDKFEEGLPYLEYINKHHKKYGDSSTVVVLNMLNGMYYNYKNDKPKAKYYFENAILLGNEGNEKSDLSYSHHEYSKFLGKNGDYQNAYKNLAIYNTLNEELNSEEKKNKANVAGINLQIDEFKREIDKIENRLKSKESILLNEQSRNKKIFIVLLSMLLLLFFLFYFYSQNVKLKHKYKLKDLRSKVQENTINATINGQQLERKKIASFLHDNISALLSSAGMHLYAHISQSESPSQEIIKTKTIIEEAHDQVRNLSHELMPSVLARFGLFDALEDLCEKNSNSILNFKYSSCVERKTRYDEDFEIKIYFIIMELLNNIIKHSQANQAKLSLKEDNGSLQIDIIDNGKGFDCKKFHILEGFGLNQIRSRLTNLKGTMDINSKINLGTSIKIIVPITYPKKAINPVFLSQ